MQKVKMLLRREEYTVPLICIALISCIWGYGVSASFGVLVGVLLLIWMIGIDLIAKWRRSKR